MTLLTDLIGRVRSEFLADDAGIVPTDNWWSDANIANALSEAQREIARRCLLIQDSTTQAVCFLPLVADPITLLFPQTLPLSSKILRIRFVLFPNFTQTGLYLLGRTTTEYLNSEHHHHRGGFSYDYDTESCETWIGRTGHVHRYMTDFQSQSLTFDRVPEYEGTVQVGVIRLPLVDMNLLDPDSAPEIQERDLALIHGALKGLYSKGYAIEDQESFNPIKESRWRKEFEADIAMITQDLAAMQPKETVCRPERGMW